jgi:hypothetical protein
MNCSSALEQACQRIRQVCSDLSETSELEQNTPPTAEWLFDNEYIVESNARRDMRLNLPRHYYQTLPALTEEPHRGLPRIYSLAKDSISIGNAFDSLRQLAPEDWRKIFEKLSRVEQLLRRDPSGEYAKMDFDTRDWVSPGC